MKITRKQLRQLIVLEAFKPLSPPPKEPTEIPVELRYVLEDFIYNYLIFIVKPRFKSMIHFYQSIHESTIKYAQNFLRYLEDSPVFGDAIYMMEDLNIRTYQDQAYWIEQYFIENWESIMQKLSRGQLNENNQKTIKKINI